MMNNLSFLPASARTLESFMFFHVHCRAYSSLPIILSAISHFHSKHYFTPPTISRSVTRSLAGAKRLFGSPSIPRKIITKEILRSLISLSFNQTVSFVTFRTVWRIVMEFYGLLRFNEVSNLKLKGLTYAGLIWVSTSLLAVRKPIKQVKGTGWRLHGNQTLFSVLLLLLRGICFSRAIHQAL